MNRTPVPLSVDVDGVQISGFYAIQSDMVTVWHPFLGSRTRTIQGELANAELTELLAELYHARRVAIRRATGTRK